MLHMSVSMTVKSLRVLDWWANWECGEMYNPWIGIHGRQYCEMTTRS